MTRNTMKHTLLKWLKITLALLPWVLSMYAFWWLDTNLWTPETPHRGKLSVLLMGTGMALSFGLQSWFFRRERAERLAAKPTA